MKPLILVVVLLMLIAPIVAQDADVHSYGTESNTYGERDRGGHHHCGIHSEGSFSEEHDSGGDNRSPAEKPGDGNPSNNGPTSERFAAVNATADALWACYLSKYAPNTPAGKTACFEDMLKAKGVPPTTLDTPMTSVEKALFEERLNRRSMNELLKPYRPEVAPDLRISVQMSPGDFGLTHCNFSAISTDGKPTNFRAASYNQAGTQQLVDNLRVIDPRAEIYFNDPKIVGVKPDNTPEHDGKVHVAWSAEPLSPAGMELLLESNPIVVKLFLEITPDKQEEALEEYKAFDFMLVTEYLKVGVPANLQAALKALKEREEAWEKEERRFKTPDFCRENRDRIRYLSDWTALCNEKRHAWECEKAELVIPIAICILGYLQKPDPVVMEAAKKALSSWNKEMHELNEEWRRAFKKRDPAWSEVLKKIAEKQGAKNREQAECNFLMECAKNHDPVALMTALKALEEKCCEQSEAKRRKECREAKAAERRKARYEAVKARLERERRERYEAWLREQALRQQNSPQGKGGGNHECYGDKCNGENWK